VAACVLFAIWNGWSMIVLRALTVLALAAAAVIPASAPALADRPPEGAAIGDFETHGTGCFNKASTGFTVTSTASFNVKYDTGTFFVQAGNGSGPLDFRKTCKLEVQVTIPAGYTVGVSWMQVFGYADVPAAASVRYRARSSWGSTTGPWQVTESRSGPYNGFWSPQSSFSSPVYAPCGGGTVPLVIDTDLTAVRSTSDRNAVTYLILQNGASFNALYQLNWKPCS
jgi:Domain of unknown function (DUF4360)